MSTSSGFSFTLSSSKNEKFGPRLGTISLARPGNEKISIETPNLLTSTSRGVIPHLSRDHYSQIQGWVNVPFESFLEQTTPTPLLSNDPLHKFLGLPSSSTLLSVSARSPTSSADMPPNSPNALSILTLRGVRKLSPTQWNDIVKGTRPYVVFAMTDTPYTRKDAPFSQKRMGKSLDRGREWLIELLKSLKDSSLTPESWRPAVFLHLPGLATPMARQHFSQQTLLEKLFPPESTALDPLKTLDDGIDGYSMDLVPIQLALDAIREKNASTPADGRTNDLPTIPSLLETSLSPLPSTKPRVMTGIESPHQLLSLISTIGVDIVDSEYLVTKLASWGVGLDIEFPVRQSTASGGKKRQIAVNLYDEEYQMDFTSIGSSSFRGALEESPSGDDRPICTCIACSPLSPPSSTVLKHGLEPPTSDVKEDVQERRKPPFTRAYIHHLLHTHEMSAHTLLTLHNHAVLSSFLSGIRDVIRQSASEAGQGSESLFQKEIRRFEETYDADLAVVKGAIKRWDEVDKARGRGRLKREREKEAQLAGTAAASASPSVGEMDVPLKATPSGEIVEELKETDERVKEGSEGKGERVRGEGAVDL